MPTIATINWHCIGDTSHNSTNEKIVGKVIQKEVMKPSLFADDIIIYLDNPK